MRILERTIGQIVPLDRDAMDSARHWQDTLTKPRGSLGILEELSITVAGITKNPQPKIENKAVIVMAADHGVVKEGVSAYPSEVTPQMVHNFLSGGAGINVLARHVGARVTVVDMGVAIDMANADVINKRIGPGTGNMAKGPAMTRDEAIRAIESGIEVLENELEKGLDIVGTGDMGIGNTTASSAIVAVITGEDVRTVTGKGTGIDNTALEEKIRTIEKAIEVNRPDPDDAIDTLAKVGGFEIGGLAGVILAGAAHNIPVVIDGFISGAAALIAAKLAPLSKDYMIPAHRSVEVGHDAVFDRLGLKPLLDLNLRLGEGTGAALGISLVEASCRLLAEMATFEDAGVSEAIEKK